MAEIAKAYVGIEPSAKGISKKLETQFSKSGKAAGTQFGSEFEKSASKSTTSLSDFGTKAIIGAAAVGAAFFGLASAAGDLSAAVSANEQVLGDASDAVQAFAEAGIENVGLSETAVLNAATAFGQLGKIIGLTGTDLSTFSTDLVTASADMAAFKNNTPTEALADLQSAFAGSPEVLRKYGIFLDEASLKQAYFRETGETVTGTLTAQQRIVATNSEIWRQGADMWGQAARESDGLERSVADLKGTVSNVAADFGAPLVGFASMLIGSVTDGLGALESWNEETGGMLATGLAAGIGIAAAAGAAAGIGVKVRDAAKWFGTLSKGMKIATGVVGGLSLAVTAGFVAYGLMTQHSREVAARTAEVAGAMDQATKDAWEYAEAASAAAGDIDGMAIAQHALGLAITSTSPEITDAFATLGIQASDAGEHLLAIGADPLEAMRGIGREAGLSSENTELLAQVISQLASRSDDFATDDLAASIFAVGEASGMTSDEAHALAEELQPVAVAMEEVFDAANPEQLADVATEFLNGAVSSSEYGESLVKQAEAQSGATRAGDDAYLVYEALLGIIEELPPGQQDAALAAIGLADAQTDAASAGEELNEVAASSIDLTTDMEDALAAAAGEADAFKSAMDRLVGGYLNHQEATDNLAAGVAELDEQIRLAQKGEEGYSLSLDENEESGRANREMIRGRIEDVLGMADAELEAGYSVNSAAFALEEQRAALIRQIRPFFETEQAAADYIDTLGLTPEAIETAVLLAQEEQTRRQVEEYIATLDNIPEEVQTNVNALIDQGNYELALRQLEQLEKNRYARIFVSTSTGGARSNGNIIPQAYGGYWPGGNPGLAWIGEAPWDEAVLTVGNPSNLQEQLTDPRILNPILRALPRTEARVATGGRRGDGDVIIQSYEQNPTPAGGAAMVRMARSR